MLSSVEQAFVGRDENELPEERLRGSEFAAFFRRCCLLVFQGGALIRGSRSTAVTPNSNLFHASFIKQYLKC